MIPATPMIGEISIPETTYKYRHDPVYRAQQIKEVKERHKRNSKSVTYKRLVYVRKQIWNVRESIDLHMRKAGVFERKLEELMKERDALATKWKNYKNGQSYRKVKS